jgi:hypothetical protein
MPRPRSSPIEDDTKRYTVTFPKKLFERIKKAAAADSRSVSSWIVLYSEQACDELAETASDHKRSSRDALLAQAMKEIEDQQKRMEEIEERQKRFSEIEDFAASYRLFKANEMSKTLGRSASDDPERNADDSSLDAKDREDGKKK